MCLFKKIIPVILAGGSGTRLWPLSRDSCPKQFLRLFGKRSLLQETVLRCSKLSKPCVVTRDSYYFMCKDQMKAVGVEAHYLLESCQRNTAPAVAIAALLMRKLYGDDCFMLVLPADHYIENDNLFVNSVLKASNAAKQHVVTFGVKPSCPLSGYGYIKAGNMCQSHSGVYEIERFIEKPQKSDAERYIKTGNYFWNSGIFMFTPNVILEQFKCLSKDTYENVALAYQDMTEVDGYCRISEQHFSKCKNISLDYEIMEKTNNSLVVPMDVGWSDLGSWSEVVEPKQCDENGNFLHGDVVANDSENCLISSSDGHFISAIGLKDQIVINTEDATLIAHRDKAQDVRHVVAMLRRSGRDIVKEHKNVERPWGRYRVISEGVGYKIKLLFINTGHKISLQAHQRRAEHWFVICGVANIINAGKNYILSSGESTIIPVGSWHRVSNVQDDMLCILEAQLGDYLGEDDIERIEDSYGRCAKNMELNYTSVIV